MRDLGDRMQDVVILTMSEFGRTVVENGNRGTDHGHGNAMMILGGGVRGGKVYGRWPGLAPEQRYEAATSPSRPTSAAVFAEVVRGHLGLTDTSRVFPGFKDGRALGLFCVARIQIRKLQAPVRPLRARQIPELDSATPDAQLRPSVSLADSAPRDSGSWEFAWRLGSREWLRT